MVQTGHLADLTPGDPFRGFCILASLKLHRDRRGRRFFSFVLRDASGSLNAVLWEYSGPDPQQTAPQIVFAQGHAELFRGAPQLVLKHLRPARPGDQVDLSALVSSAPIDVEACFQEVRKAIGSIRDPDYRRLASLLLQRHEEQFRTVPLAGAPHHCFRCGLLMHTRNTLRLADFACELYPFLNRDLLLAGALLHDFARARAFRISPLSEPDQGQESTLAGELLGPPVMGAREVAAAARELDIPPEKSELLQHLILSHPGKPEEGAAVTPLLPEAEALSLLNGIDVRLELLREGLEQVPRGASTPAVPPQNRIFHHAV